MSTSITWLGHAGIKLVSPGGKTILIDPWFTGNPKAPFPIEQLDRCDLLLITHAHSDHASDAPAIAKRFGCPLVTIFDFTQILAKQGLENLIGINKGGSVEVQGIKITATQALHSSTYTGPDGESVYAGEPMGFVLRLEDGTTLYHAGDTALFWDMKLIGEMHHPSLAFLPIGDHFTMGPMDAAYAAKLLEVKKIVPIHWGTFPLLIGTPGMLKHHLEDTKIDVIDLAPGGSYTL
jgi:L-ascorbate metabolism protein UlaG (beta-lactamase superfamily)